MAEHDHGAHKDECNCSGLAIVCKGLAVMFILIGLTVFLVGAVWLFNSGRALIALGLGFHVLWGIIVVLFAVWVLSWVFRMLAHRHRGCCCCCNEHGHGHGYCCCGGQCNCDECKESMDDKESKPARRRASK
jgi:hypothetical protein